MDTQLRKRFASPKPKYRITNWRDYNAALVKRGSLTLWIDEAVIDRWHAVSGKGAVYHDDAILCALCLRQVFDLALRQTQGFLHSLALMLELGVAVPHYSTLSRRASGLKVPTQCLSRHNQLGPLHLVIDSTGLKVFGEGEWKVRTHGVGKRRVWRKLHLGVDEASGEILAHELTMNNVHDGPVLPGLLDQIDEPLDQVSADTAYDSFRCHRAIHERNARPVIPPRRGASIHPPPGMKDPPPTRGQIVRRIHQIGRKEWKKEAGYHRRSWFVGRNDPVNRAKVLRFSKYKNTIQYLPVIFTLGTSRLFRRQFRNNCPFFIVQIKLCDKTSISGSLESNLLNQINNMY